MPTDTLDAGLLHTGRPDRSPPEGADIAPLENEPFADAVVRLGHSGPRWWPGGSKGWDGCYALGMIGGAVIGVWGLPSIDPALALAGGWMGVLDLCCIGFIRQNRAVREELREPDGRVAAILWRAHADPFLSGRKAKLAQQWVVVLGIHAAYRMLLLLNAVVRSWSTDYFVYTVAGLIYLPAMPMTALRCVGLVVPVTVCCEALVNRARRIQTQAEEQVNASLIAAASRELSTDLAVAHQWLRPILLTGFMFFMIQGILFFILGLGPKATTGWFAKLPHGTALVIGAFTCWLGHFLVLCGPNKVTRQMDELNGALRTLPNAHLEPEQLPQDSPEPEGTVVNGVSGPHGVQWLMGDDTLAKVACLASPRTATRVRFADEL